MFRLIIVSISLLSLVDVTSAFVRQQPASRKSLSSSTSVLAAYHGKEVRSFEHDRRTFTVNGMAAAVTSLFLPQIMTSLPASADDSSTSVDYKAVAKDIMDLVNKNPDWGPSKFCTVIITV